MANATREDVTRLYSQLLGRAPESEDIIASWTRLPLVDVALSIAGGADCNTRATAHHTALVKMLAPRIDGFIPSNSKSQHYQDLFALAALGFKRDGFFVDFGAAEGIHCNNSYILEAEFGWRGICAEPARFWHAQLKASRTAIIDTRCVWSVSGLLLDFDEVVHPEISTLSAFSDADYLSDLRKQKVTYKVETVSLQDLLIQNNAPAIIDYLSIDTEGSELEILKGLDYSRYAFRVITCEHNFTGLREPINDFLASKGYVRRLPELSSFDDWYVRPDLV